MLYKLYKYSIVDDAHKVVGPDRHFPLFERSKGKDTYGQLAEHRGKKNAILMYLRRFGSDFTGLIGKYSVEREVTSYDDTEDVAQAKVVGDEDYPHAAFVCMPRLSTIAVVDTGRIKADAAIDRLNRILAHRCKILFLAEPVTESFDLRKAVKRFKLVEVTFDIYPVNPHTGDLGRKLDEARKLDHIKRINGKMRASEGSPLELNGGFLTSVQQLQQSGHSKVGFRGVTEHGVTVQVPKPGATRQLADDEESSRPGEKVATRINFEGLRLRYPFTQGHVTALRSVVKSLAESGVDE